jgi:glutamyl-tRNA synthetase
LEAYVGEVFLADSKSYQTPQHYVERNRYFFRYDVSEVPAEADTYDKDVSISAEALSKFTTELLADFDLSQSYRESRFESPKPNREADAKLTSFDVASTRIHAAMNHEIWKTITKSASPDTADIPFTDQPVDLQAVAAHFSERSNVPADDLVKQYKSWNKALMRYLREKLSYGLPGPGVGAIMAILGYEECCRRLDVRTNESKGGW